MGLTVFPNCLLAYTAAMKTSDFGGAVLDLFPSQVNVSFA